MSSNLSTDLPFCERSAVGSITGVYIRHELPVGHSLLEVLEHAGFSNGATGFNPSTENETRIFEQPFCDE